MQGFGFIKILPEIPLTIYGDCFSRSQSAASCFSSWLPLRVHRRSGTAVATILSAFLYFSPPFYKWGNWEKLSDSRCSVNICSVNKSVNLSEATQPLNKGAKTVCFCFLLFFSFLFSSLVGRMGGSRQSCCRRRRGREGEDSCLSITGYEHNVSISCST